MQSIEEAILAVFDALYPYFRSVRAPLDTPTSISYRFDFLSDSGTLPSLHYSYREGALLDGGFSEPRQCDVQFETSIDDFVAYAQGVIPLRAALDQGVISVAGESGRRDAALSVADDPATIRAYLATDAWFHEVLMSAIARWLASGAVDLAEANQLSTAFGPDRGAVPHLVPLLTRLADEVRTSTASLTQD